MQCLYLTIDCLRLLTHWAAGHRGRLTGQLVTGVDGVVPAGGTTRHHQPVTSGAVVAGRGAQRPVAAPLPGIGAVPSRRIPETV